MSTSGEARFFPTGVGRRTFLGGLGGAALISAVGLPLAACSDGSRGGAKNRTLTFVYYGTAEQQAAYDKLFIKFKADHPEITLKAQGIAANSWDEFANAVATRLAGGQEVDVIQIATEGQRIFASKQLLEPLDPYIAKDQALVDAYYADTPPQLKKWLSQYASPDGKTYYMPGGYNTMALYVNKKQFTAAGIDVPTATWTWEEFRQTGLDFKKKTGAYFTGSVGGGNGYFTSVMPWLTNNGASTFSADWATPTFASDAAVEALTFARSLVVDGLAPDPGGTYDAPTQMAQGKLASFGGGRWPTNNLRTLGIVDQVELVRWPQKAAAGSPVGWDAWPILKQSKNKDDAWTLIKYLISKEFGATITSGGANAVPARISDASSQAFLANAPQGTDRLVELLKVATPVPAPNRGAEIQKAIQEAWLAGITGNKEPQAALKEANDKLGTLLS